LATVESQETDSARGQRYREAVVLLRKWLGEDSAYDEQVGAILDRQLSDDVMQCREDHEPSA
jgi:hypothetical protein